MDLLARITLNGLKTRKTRNGVAWTATVCLDGKRLMLVEDDGNGGSSRFSPLPDGNYQDMRAFVKQADNAAATALGDEHDYGCFANLLSCMEKDMTALDAVPIWKAALAA